MFDVFYSGTKPNLFVHEQEARDIEHAKSLSRTRYFWWVNYLTDYTGWDFLWEPVPWESNYTHTWPSQWHEYSGTYLVPKHADNIEYKFHKNVIPNREWRKNYTTLSNAVDFDYSWHPHPKDPPYNYVFGNQWWPANRMPTVTYPMPGATETKYIFTPRAVLLPQHTNNWQILADCEFDYSWVPDPGDPPFIYVFGNQWHRSEIMPTVEYHVPGATERKYLPHPRAQLVKNTTLWTVSAKIDSSTVDYSWVPDPGDPPYIYQFGTQHQATGGPRYHVPGATEIKYVSTPRSKIINIDMSNWVTPDNIADFDYTWHPDHRDPPYIYQFGTQHQATGGPRYHVPGASEIKYVNNPRSRRTVIDNCWSIPDNTNLEAFDFTWHPDDRDPPYRYQFGTQWNRAGGPEYCVSGATELKYTTAQMAKMLPTDKNWFIPNGIDINSFDFSWTPDTTEQPFIYEFGTQWQKTGGPRYHVPGATEVKYITEPRAIKTSIDHNWTVPDKADTASFDFTWHPDATESPYQYQFGTQHQRTGGPQYKVPGATEVKYIDQLRITTNRVATAIYEIDHMDGNAGQIADTVKTVRYFDNYLDTLRRIAKSIPPEHEFVWICSSVCDYTDFDFTWHPEQWQASMLHVFPSDGEKFGDTFFMHVPTFQYRAEKCQLLEWYDLNFMDQSLPRRPLPVIRHDFDTHVEAVKTLDFTGPLAIYTTQDLVDDPVIPPVPLWREKTKTIVPLSQGASVCIVPKVAVPVVKTQLYDYPYILRTQRHLHNEQPLDIVFIDNGETNANNNYNHMVEVASLTWQNRIHRSSGVSGRVAAYHAAAELSTTPWFFAVFAKLSVNKSFDWLWQPDRMQEPKHYIFHARNPVNGLEYGHQAMIAYNRELVLNNLGQGLDFTLDSAHEVVPILSGTAHYNDTPWMAWRTAFREVLKLQASLPDVENEYRIKKWRENTSSMNSIWSMHGANDAIEYYETVRGDFELLRNSYDWAWLASYALLKRNLISE
jgi:hypothetical protein